MPKIQSIMIHSFVYLHPLPPFFKTESWEGIHWLLNRLMKDENSGFMSHLGFWKGRRVCIKEARIPKK